MADVTDRAKLSGNADVGRGVVMNVMIGPESVKILGREHTGQLRVDVAYLANAHKLPKLETDCFLEPPMRPAGGEVSLSTVDHPTDLCWLGSMAALDSSLSNSQPAEPHGSGIASRLNWLRAGVLGANDGIVSVAAIVVGVAGVSHSAAAIIAAGARWARRRCGVDRAR